MKTHIGFRASCALQSAVDRVGDVSAAARGLIILGLVASGHDVSALKDEMLVALPGITDVRVQEQLSALLFNSRVTDVKHSQALLPLAPKPEPEPAPADLWTVGIEV